MRVVLALEFDRLVRGRFMVAPAEEAELEGLVGVVGEGAFSGKGGVGGEGVEEEGGGVVEEEEGEGKGEEDGPALVALVGEKGAV